jgi:hypothetical protein
MIPRACHERFCRCGRSGNASPPERPLALCLYIVLGRSGYTAATAGRNLANLRAAVTLRQNLAAAEQSEWSDPYRCRGRKCQRTHIEREVMVKLPPKVVKEFGLSADVQKHIDALNEYDFSYLTNALSDGLIRQGRVYSVEQAYPIIARFGRCDREIAKRLEDEFKRFVVLTFLAPKVPHAPPGAVDMYWHFFILHTEEYAEFCEKIWGSFQPSGTYRHHYPANDDTRPVMLDAYIETRRLYVKVFGEPKPHRVKDAPSEGVYVQVAGSFRGDKPHPDGYYDVEVWTGESKTSGDSYSGYIPDNHRRIHD